MRSRRRRPARSAAGARDGWAYVWPRDAATAALALEASGHHEEARAVAKFLAGLDLTAAARFTESGAPVPGRAAQGDALGWVDAAAKATGVPGPSAPFPWRDRADYQESSPGTYLGNALAAATSGVGGPKTGHIGGFSARQHQVAGEGAGVLREFEEPDGLVRAAGDPGSGLDSAAGWAIRPFELTALYPAAERRCFDSSRPARPTASPPAKVGRAAKTPGPPRPPGPPGPSPHSQQLPVRPTGGDLGRTSLFVREGSPPVGPAKPRSNSSPISAAPPPNRATSPSGWAPTPASRPRPLPCSGRAPSPSSPCANSGPSRQLPGGLLSFVTQRVTKDNSPYGTRQRWRELR